jgi:hypothetical protein
LVGLFSEHRSEHLTKARRFIGTELTANEEVGGLESLPEPQRLLMLDQLFFYDNLGALALHNIVPIEMISGYLGGALISVWEKVLPLVQMERLRRGAGNLDRGPWLQYTEALYNLVVENQPTRARLRLLRKRKRWTSRFL